MSAIAGILYTDDHQVERADLERMVATMAHRGVDGCGYWQTGEVGFGHRMFRTTPESLFETLPFVDEVAQLAITADARLDNRAELSAALGCTADGVSDSQLILLAYARWSEQCVDHLLGDFAFVVWDARRRQLFCARDHFGIRPFYYHYGPHAFHFASEVKALRCLDAVPSILNETRIAEYLVMLFDDVAATFYQGIYRLPPAHTLVIDRQGMRVRQYWSLDPSYELRLKSDAEYAEVFRATFAEAIRCRLRSAFPVGSALSGGMDSSSITCMARQLLREEGQQRRLHTFSGTYESVPVCDEQRYSREVIAQGGIDAIWCRSMRSARFRGI